MVYTRRILACVPLAVPRDMYTAARAQLSRAMECSICLEQVSNDFRTPCGHEFHEKCFLAYQDRCTEAVACPVCKSMLARTQPTDVETGESSSARRVRRESYDFNRINRMRRRQGEPTDEELAWCGWWTLTLITSVVVVLIVGIVCFVLFYKPSPDARADTSSTSRSNETYAHAP